MGCRKGQKQFRKNIIKRTGYCEATLSDKINLCEAAHIKPYSQCTDDEKMDPNNSLCLIASVHKAFDCGYISFDENGFILTSSILSQLDLECFGLTGRERIKIPGKRGEYLDFHRKNVFKL